VLLSSGRGKRRVMAAGGACGCSKWRGCWRKALRGAGVRTEARSEGAVSYELQCQTRKHTAATGRPGVLSVPYSNCIKMGH
jgi:hypothetical protein